MRHAPLALAAALPLALAACAATVPFDVTREVPVETGAGAWEIVEEIDLSTEPDLWDRRDELEELAIDRVGVTVLAVNAANEAAAATLAVRFRPDGGPSDGSADVAVGAIDGLALVPGASAEILGTPALKAFLGAALRGSGRFQAVLSASVEAPADVLLELQLEGSMTVKFEP